MYKKWAETSPDEANTFLKMCSYSDEPEVRLFAGEIALEWAERSPNFATEIILRVLSDEDEAVRGGVARIMHDNIDCAESADEFIMPIGIHNLAKIIKAYKEYLES